MCEEQKIENAGQSWWRFTKIQSNVTSLKVYRYMMHPQEFHGLSKMSDLFIFFDLAKNKIGFKDNLGYTANLLFKEYQNRWCHKFLIRYQVNEERQWSEKV